jgi:hypothetical protein
VRKTWCTVPSAFHQIPGTEEIYIFTVNLPEYPIPNTQRHCCTAAIRTRIRRRSQLHDSASLRTLEQTEIEARDIAEHPFHSVTHSRYAFEHPERMESTEHQTEDSFVTFNHHAPSPRLGGRRLQRQG